MVEVPVALLLSLVGLGVSNLGVLIFFLGRITEKMRAYDQWAAQCEKCGRVVSILANKEGLSL